MIQIFNVNFFNTTVLKAKVLFPKIVAKTQQPACFQERGEHEPPNQTVKNDKSSFSKLSTYLQVSFFL